jgi:hypothetical protein
VGRGAWNHIPYRTCKLTHVLKDCLGGNCATLLIANVWGEAAQLDETLSTCRCVGQAAEAAQHGCRAWQERPPPLGRQQRAGSTAGRDTQHLQVCRAWHGQAALPVCSARQHLQVCKAWHGGQLCLGRTSLGWRGCEPQADALVAPPRSLYLRKLPDGEYLLANPGAKRRGRSATHSSLRSVRLPLCRDTCMLWVSTMWPTWSMGDVHNGESTGIGCNQCVSVCVCACACAWVHVHVRVLELASAMSCMSQVCLTHGCAGGRRQPQHIWQRGRARQQCTRQGAGEVGAPARRARLRFTLTPTRVPVDCVTPHHQRPRCVSQSAPHRFNSG